MICGRRIKEIEGSSKGMYIRSTSDILPKWKDMRNIEDIPKLYAIAKPEVFKYAPILKM